MRGATRVTMVELNRGRLEQAAAIVKPDHVVCSAETDAVDDIIKFTDGRGVDVIITAAVSDEDAKTKFPKGWKAIKPYLRVTPQPNK